jgi:hypothetical protein
MEITITYDQPAGKFTAVYSDGRPSTTHDFNGVIAYNLVQAEIRAVKHNLKKEYGDLITINSAEYADNVITVVADITTPAQGNPASEDYIAESVESQTFTYDFVPLEVAQAGLLAGLLLENETHEIAL